jgi:hypothetical protein
MLRFSENGQRIWIFVQSKVSSASGVDHTLGKLVCGLDTLIASSYGSQQKVASQMEQLLGQFGQEEDRRLG